MKRPIVTGREFLIGKDAQVISKSGQDHRFPYLVQVENVLWTAGSDDDLESGEKVTVIAVESNRLSVKRPKRGPADKTDDA